MASNQHCKATSSVLLHAFDTASPLHMYPATVELYRQGVQANDVYLLESGLAKLVRLEPDGGELIFALRFPGSLLGNISAVINKPHPLTAITLVNSHLRRITADQFRQLLQTNPEFSWHVHQIHSEIAFDQVLRQAQLSLTTARQRLEQLLWQFIVIQEFDGDDTDVWLKIPLKFQEIAALIAISPTYLSRLFAQLEEDGVLLRKGGRLIIRSPQKLRRQVDN